MVCCSCFCDLADDSGVASVAGSSDAAAVAVVDNDWVVHPHGRWYRGNCVSSVVAVHVGHRVLPLLRSPVLR